jgi:NADH:ubiquinone reductase (H+-translocating)
MSNRREYDTMSSAFRRDVIVGGVAGLIGGVIYGVAIVSLGMMAGVAGLIGLNSPSAGLTIHLAISVLLGASFAAIFRYQPAGATATVSGGVLYGLLWWVVGPLTLQPALMGKGPTWSFAEVDAAFPNLIGHLLYGGVTGALFYALVTAFLRRRPATTGSEALTPVKRHVLILGGGFGGVSAAQRLEHLLWRDPSVEITLVSPSNFLLFTPMLAEVASSGLEARHISAPIRAAFARTRVWHAEVTAVHPEERIVEIRGHGSGSNQRLPYDHLVFAVGAVPTFYGLPGLEEYAFTLKTLEDATRLRNHVIARLEEADVEANAESRRRLLTFVVVGGGFSGTEMIAELFDLVRDILPYYPGIRPDEPHFILVHSHERILPEISPGLADYALRRLQARGITFELGQRVVGATSDSVLLGDGRALTTGTLVWTTGNRPHPVLEGLTFTRNRAGAVVVDEMLRVKGELNVWAVGDCAEVPDWYNGGKPCPPTAQHALREGTVAAENIAAALRGRSPHPFKFRTIGMLVALGHRTAVAELRGWKFSGFLAWLMWRSVYLSKLPGLEKKTRVALDWLVDLLFPRDIVLTEDRRPSPALAARAGGPAAGPGRARAPLVGEGRGPS